MKIPFMFLHAQAGFPSPATDWVERDLNIADVLVPHAASTYIVRVAGDSMNGIGIFDGDLLVVDKALEAAHGSLIIAVLEGVFVLKRLEVRGDEMWLSSEHPAYPPLFVAQDRESVIWGVVTFVIKPIAPVGPLAALLHRP